MKKIFVFLGLILLLTGCGKESEKNIINDLNNKIENSKAYHMVATLEIYRNEEKYTYNVDSSYKMNDLFKVNLINQNNNHEQIILKNENGVFVLTPSLNKSFKFQSDWPYNNSQIYLLQPIINDIKNDSKKTFEKTDDGYLITSSVNYSTEKDFKKQKVYLDKEKNIKKVEIVDETDNIKMCLNIIEIDYKPTFDDNYFDENTYQKLYDQNENNTDDKNTQDNNQTNPETSTTSKLEEIVYPMYVPVDTYLTGQDTVSTSSGERVILTFSGESAFTIVQETMKNNDTLNYVYGDPYLILDTVGSITDYSVSWISNGVEYSVMSDTMDLDELLTVAQSISVAALAK